MYTFSEPGINVKVRSCLCSSGFELNLPKEISNRGFRRDLTLSYICQCCGVVLSRRPWVGAPASLRLSWCHRAHGPAASGNRLWHIDIYIFAQHHASWSPLRLGSRTAFDTCRDRCLCWVVNLRRREECRTAWVFGWYNCFLLERQKFSSGKIQNFPSGKVQKFFFWRHIKVCFKTE